MTGPAKKLAAWLLEGVRRPDGHSAAHSGVHTAVHQDHWWRVMCLTGVDYFSSMGFQPGIAFLAAGLLSPLATLNLVILTLFGALPAYWLVAKESPHGQGSFAIFERLLSGWIGKSLVLVLLGFAATDFIFTITMCAADATAHIVENPWVPEVLRNRLWITLGLVGALGLVFLRGFGEAVRFSVWLVIAYMAVNVVTLSVCVSKVLSNPAVIADWMSQLQSEYGSPLKMFAVSAVVFPQLALGMSGFETGVAVMPMVRGKSTDIHSIPERVANTRLLLVTVALIMAVFLLVGSTVCTLLIPPEMFREGGEANGRALAYLSHLYLGDAFGTVYDVSTVFILWFAGASGMAALLSLVPQYLPRYGMAPDWALARRPLVLFFTAVAALITVVFNADVDAQAGAFATGLLVMITSAAVAVTLIVWNRGPIYRLFFTVVSAVFVYASIAVIIGRPDGLVISLCFIAAVLGSSILSRAMRSTELRIGEVRFDEEATRFIRQVCSQHLGEVRLLAHRAGHTDYPGKERDARFNHSIQAPEGNFIFLEITPSDVSEFVDDSLDVTGHQDGDFMILRCSSPSVPNAIAGILLHVREIAGKIPHAYFAWTEGHPIAYVFKYILLGEGETAPLTREILRSAEPDPERRPKVHVA